MKTRSENDDEVNLNEVNLTSDNVYIYLILQTSLFSEEIISE